MLPKKIKRCVQGVTPSAVQGRTLDKEVQIEVTHSGFGLLKFLLYVSDRVLFFYQLFQNLKPFGVSCGLRSGVELLLGLSFVSYNQGL